MIEEGIEIVGGVQVADDIRKRIQKCGARELDIEKATELGVFKRLSNLACVFHATIMAAYSIYGEFDLWMDELGARRHEIKREMNLFDKAIDRFIRFWTRFYDADKSHLEISVEAERLADNIMEWMNIPKNWELGDKQRTDKQMSACLRVQTPNKDVFTFYKSTLNQELVGEARETWCVLCFDPQAEKQTTAHTNIDKATAMMLAKILSEENPSNIYAAALVRDVQEKRTDVIPVKAFMANKTVGKLTE